MEVPYWYWLGHHYFLCDKTTTDIGLGHIALQIAIKYNFIVEGV